MRRTFELPDLGEGLAKAEVVEWHVAVGDPVAEDQDLVDLQTDKAIVTVPCPFTGTLVERHGEAGDTIAVGAPLIVVEVAGDASVRDAEPAAAAVAAAPETPVAPAPAPVAPAPAAGGRRPLAAPSVRRRARELGIDLATLAGSGPAGRIVAADLDRPPMAVSAPAAAPRASSTPMRGLRRATARAMTAGWQAIPHMFDFREADATALLAARAALRAEAERVGDLDLAKALSPLTLLIKIAVVALAQHPELHGYVDAERELIVHHDACHLGVAVAAPDGLLTPVLRDAGTRPVADLAVELRGLVAAARTRALTAEQLGGATFLINNLGALGTWYGTPLIPPGLGGNLGFGRVVDRPVVRDGAVVAGQVLPLSISADHRLVDGDVLAAFAGTVVRLVETPALLLGALR
jgi:pyruvate dehydrogenase E2 component (dihydrolipoamide acetyltransferase)